MSLRDPGWTPCWCVYKELFGILFQLGDVENVCSVGDTLLAIDIVKEYVAVNSFQESSIGLYIWSFQTMSFTATLS
jgi:hypothetical protein